MAQSKQIIPTNMFQRNSQMTINDPSEPGMKNVIKHLPASGLVSALPEARMDKTSGEVLGWNVELTYSHEKQDTSISINRTLQRYGEIRGINIKEQSFKEIIA